MKCPMEKKKIWVLLFFILIPHIKFQDPISNRSWTYAKCDLRMHTRMARAVLPDILFTRLPYYTKCQSWKREIIQKNVHWILPKINQIVYNMLDTICEPNIMILAQTILQICIWLSRFERVSFVRQISWSSGSPVILMTRFHRCIIH